MADWRDLARPAVYRLNPNPEPPDEVAREDVRAHPPESPQASKVAPGTTNGTLVLPYPPSVNDVWRIFTPPRGGHARIIKTKAARDYRGRVLLAVGDLQPLSGPVEVVGRAYRPRRVGDLDNVLKVLLDALKGLAFHDDKQVVRLEFTRHDDKAHPRVEVQVRPVVLEQGVLL